MELSEWKTRMDFLLKHRQRNSEMCNYSPIKSRGEHVHSIWGLPSFKGRFNFCFKLKFAVNDTRRRRRRKVEMSTQTFNLTQNKRKIWNKKRLNPHTSIFTFRIGRLCFFHRYRTSCKAMEIILPGVIITYLLLYIIIQSLVILALHYCASK